MVSKCQHRNRADSIRYLLKELTQLQKILKESWTVIDSLMEANRSDLAQIYVDETQIIVIDFKEAVRAVKFELEEHFMWEYESGAPSDLNFRRIYKDIKTNLS